MDNLSGSNARTVMISRFTKLLMIFALGVAICSALGVDMYAQSSSPAPAVTQPRRRRLPSLEDQLKRLTDLLSLDSTQQAKLRAILDKRQMRLWQVHDDQSLSAVERFNAMRAVHDRADDEIAKILTPKQATKFEELRPRKNPRPDNKDVTILPTPR